MRTGASPFGRRNETMSPPPSSHPSAATGLGGASPLHWRSALRRPVVADALVGLAALAVLGVAMASIHALTSGLSGSDEGAHFLNGYLVWSYLTEAFGRNPLAFATEFYVHYPKISIGHWPPLYYVFLSVFFFVLPQRVGSLMGVNLVVGAWPAWLISRLVRPLFGWRWALLAALAYVLLPISLGNTSRLMLDQAVAGLCLWGALRWSAYARAPSLWRGLAYAALAATAVLVKGNGWVLAVFPLFHIALTRRWRLLADWRTWVSGAAALAAVGAWTLVTYKISSDGFNYAWGPGFFLRAMPYYLSALVDNLGWWGVLAALAGAAVALRRGASPELREIGHTGLALVLATLLFQSIVPVDLDPRYLSPALPHLVVFMVIGTQAAWQRLPMRQPARWRPALRVARLLLPGLLLVPGLLYLHGRPVRYDLRMDQVARELASRPGGQVVVVDGHAGTEGALASEVALRDRARQRYVVRSSQLLAKSDFMGARYALKVATPAAVLPLLDEIGCNAVVVAEGVNILPRLAHSDQLRQALELPNSPFRLAQTHAHIGEAGRTLLFLRKEPVAPRPDAVRRVNFPEKAPR